MSDWLRSFTLLGAAFAAVMVTTLGVAEVLVPGGGAPEPVAEAPGSSAAAAPTPPPPAGGIPGLGGTLAISGDRQGTFRLTGESIEEFYSLVGNDGRIVLTGQPVEVSQISYDGLEFFPDPGQCSISAGNLDNAIGIGFADFRCDDIADIRDQGVISMAGEIGLPVDMLVERQLPQAGGTVDVGGETWSFENAFLFTWQMPTLAGNQQWNLTLSDEVAVAALGFDYDIETHRLSLVHVERNDESMSVPDDACSVAREELGKQNPRTTVSQLTIECPHVEVPGLGPVPIRGTLVVDELAWPE